MLCIFSAGLIVAPRKAVAESLPLTGATAYDPEPEQDNLGFAWSFSTGNINPTVGQINHNSCAIAAYLGRASIGVFDGIRSADFTVNRSGRYKLHISGFINGTIREGSSASFPGGVSKSGGKLWIGGGFTSVGLEEQVLHETDFSSWAMITEGAWAVWNVYLGQTGHDELNELLGFIRDYTTAEVSWNGNSFNLYSYTYLEEGVPYKWAFYVASSVAAGAIGIDVREVALYEADIYGLSADLAYLDSEILNPPTGITASNGDYTDKVRVIWNTVSDAEGYDIYRNTASNSDTATKVGTNVGKMNNLYDDTSAVPGTYYYYWVRSKKYSPVLVSELSNPDSGYAAVPPTGGVPQITGYTPASGPIGTRMKIVGNNFGSSTGKVYFMGSSEAHILSWSDTDIKCIVWTGAVSGEFYVRTAGAVNSNTGYLTVTQPTTIYVHDGSPQDIENGTQTWPFNLQGDEFDYSAMEDLVFLPGVYYLNIEVGSHPDAPNFRRIKSIDPDNPAIVASTILDGSGSGHVVEAGSNTIIEGLTIRNGAGYDGGAIHIVGENNITIRKNVIEGNSATHMGGGIYCKDSENIMIENNVIRDNSAWMGGAVSFAYCSSTTISKGIITANSAWYGGGIYCGASILSLENVTISGNTATNYEGGGIRCNQSSLSLNNVTISGNIANKNGGGIDCTDNSNLSLADVTVSDNTAELLRGGGIRCRYKCTVSLERVIITGNSAGRDGGGISSYDTDLNLEHVTISENTANWNGGGIYCDHSSPELINVKVVENSAARDGGAVYCFLSSIPNLTNVTASSNTADYGSGGVYCYGSSSSAIISNSIIWANGQNLYRGEATYSCIGDKPDGTGNIDIDPLFIDAPNSDYHLLPGSPCIDAGDPTSDFSLEPQPNGGRINMGAYGNTPEATTSEYLDTLTISSTAGGSVSSPGEGPLPYNHGSSVPIVATANANYHFVNWTGTAVAAGKVANPSAANTTVTVDADYTLQANFAINTFTLDYIAGFGGSLTGNTSQVVDYGSDGTAVTAVPDTGYHFVDWSDASTNNPRTDTNVTANINVTASFAIDQYTLRTSSTTGGSVITPGEGTFEYDRGEEITLEAEAELGYHFTNWSGSYSTIENPITITMDQDYIAKANFEITLIIIYVDDDSPNDPAPYDPAYSDPNEDGTAEHPFDMIQEGIDAALDGEMVFVRDGTYREAIEFAGRNITVTGFDPNEPNAILPYPVINANYTGTAVTFWNEEEPNCILEGFVITRGAGDVAGGINCMGSSPTISHCLILGNHVMDPNGGGGAVFCIDSNAVFENCTFSGNYGGQQGAGLYFCDSNAVLLNCIVWDNLPYQIAVACGLDPNITFSDVQDAWPGQGNIDIDPCFADAELGDYHLKSQAGRWEPNSASWLIDDVTSLCIDAGDPNSDWTAELRPHGKRINMGAYGGTPQASMSSLSEALDTALSFTTGGDADWFGQTATAYYGGDAAQSGDISDRQESWMQTTVSGAGTVSFYWKVSSEGDYYDYLKFYIDGELQGQISGTVDWQQMTYTISTSGPHTLEWRYTKDQYVSKGDDCGWVDKVEWGS